MTAPQEEWTEWRLHDGGPRVIGLRAGDVAQLEAIVDGIKKSTVKVVTQEMVEADASDNARGQIIRYRLKKPRALLDLIQLIADLPAPVKTDGVIA